MIDLNTLIIIFVFITGACIGSFLNVVALRGLSGESIVLPPSKCPKCGNKLNWYTNIPIISYIFLSGRCQFCKKPISIQYPVVEFLNAFLYTVCFLNFGFTLKTLFLLPLISLCIVISITDLKESVVFDVHTYIIIVLGLIYSAFGLGEINFTGSVIGIAAGFVIFELLARSGYLLAGTRAFGEGDTLIAMGLGAFFGWKALILIIFLSVILQAAFTLPMLFVNTLKKKNYLCAGAYMALVLSLAAVYLFRKFDLYSNFPLILILLLIVCLVLLFALIVILDDIKKKKENEETGEKEGFLYLPFGPALVFAGLITIFYQPYLEDFARSIIGF